MRMEKRLLVWLIFLPLINLFAGTTGKIAGRITDATTKEPLAGVNVFIEGTYLGAATDPDGYYVILNIPPGSYKLTATFVGYTPLSVTDVRVNIDQTTTINFKLKEETLQMGQEITVIAKRPIVERDVAASRANLNIKDVENLPVISVPNVVALQAGVEGMSIRGGGLDQVAFVVDGLTMRDERTNQPYTTVSLTSVDEIQIQAGGFSAEFGNIRSGIVNVVTKEGSKNKYNFAFLGRYRAPAPKHFGISPNSPNAYWIRPFVDDAVCWVGTKNGAWDKHIQDQYPEFKGWNQISRETLQNDDPNDDLTPQAAQQVFLWQHRRQLDIQKPDYSIDASFGGPVPFISKDLGNLRFFTSYTQDQNAYLIPLSEDAHRNYNWQLKLTSDMKLPGIKNRVKVMFSTMLGRTTGTDRNNNGYPGMFNSTWRIASALSNGPKYIDARMFGTDYWGPSRVDYTSIGMKFTHAFSEKGFHEGSIHYFESRYNTNPAARRDTSRIYKFGNNYYVDEAPFGFEPASVAGIDGMRMGAGMSDARDSSKVSYLNLKYDFTDQFNRFNNFKMGAEFNYSWSNVNYARFDEFLPRWNRQVKWNRNPVRGAIYVQDKLEFKGMVAQAGLRLDYSHAGGKWYVYDPYNKAFSSVYSNGIDTLLQKKPTKHIFTLSPRLAISFPISENSKLYFNYGHFRQLPIPEDLYLLGKSGFSNQVNRIAMPNNPLPKTIAYELGYEHNLFDQYLLRVAGYYKDISEQPKLVRYENFDGSVSYQRAEPNSYEDIRGFEITLRKNRGRWFRGFVNYTYMVSTYGYFGYGIYYENPAQQRDYEKTSTYYYQNKPKPRPYARANLDFFSPEDFGPHFSRFYPLGNLRINLLASWKTGRYETWAGGSSIPGLFANVQWPDYWNVDFRLSKNFQLGKSAKIEFFVDLYNAFNFKHMTNYGFIDYNDRRSYMTSLHLPSSTEGIDQFGYTNIPGHDRPGDYRKPGVPFVPIIARDSYQSVSNPNDNDLYYFASAAEGVHGTGYYRYHSQSGTWTPESKSTVNKILKDKSYIDMPNQTYFTFLDPRNIFWGIRISFDL